MAKIDLINKEESLVESVDKKVKKNPRKKDISLLREYRNHTSNNEIEILHSKECGCYFCRSIFSARNVQDWINDDKSMTALCPECGMDTVLGDGSGIEITKDLMKQMNLAFFGNNLSEGNRKGMETYCSRYNEYKITHKAKSEALYIDYLTRLEEMDFNPEYSLILGDLYNYGTQFTQANKEEAFLHYSKPSLSNNADALTSIGFLKMENATQINDYRIAYECFAKAIALGSTLAKCGLADCYLHGYFVQKDEKTNFEIVSNGFSKEYDAWLKEKSLLGAIPEFAIRLAFAYEYGLGTSVEEETALRLYLISEFTARLRYTLTGYVGDIGEKAKLGIERLAAKHNLTFNKPMFDIDTFEDCIEEFSILNEEKKVAPVGFDEEDRTLVLEITFEEPTLMSDIGNLFVGFINGPVNFNLNDVATVNGSGGSFNKIEGDYDSGYRFIYVSPDGEEDIVLEIFFSPDAPKEER